MIIKNRLVAFIFRTVVALSAYIGLIFILVSMPTFVQAISLFVFYTLLSNLLIAIIFTLLAVRTLFQLIKEGAEGEPFSLNPIIHIGSIVLITITFIIFATLLTGNSFSMAQSDNMALRTISNILLHYITPMLSILEFILFVPKGEIRISHIFCWTAVPAFYYLFTIIRAQIGGAYEGFVYSEALVKQIGGMYGLHLPYPLPQFGSYPYFFIDSTLFGWGFVLGFVALFIIFVIMLGFVFFGLDKLFVGLQNRKNKAI